VESVEDGVGEGRLLEKARGAAARVEAADISEAAGSSALVPFESRVCLCFVTRFLFPPSRSLFFLKKNRVLPAHERAQGCPQSCTEERARPKRARLSSGWHDA
jgi:hypothetical protein